MRAESKTLRQISSNFNSALTQIRQLVNRVRTAEEDVEKCQRSLARLEEEARVLCEGLTRKEQKEAWQKNFTKLLISAALQLN